MTSTTVSKVTQETLLSALQEVVKENPQRVYKAPRHMDVHGSNACFYVHLDEEGAQVGAGCIVGTVLHRLGVSLEALRRVEGLGVQGALSGLGLSGDQLMWPRLRRIQISQDKGSTWGEAYAAEFGEMA
ncbi:hypothetical protein ABCR94_38185 [Streptomyces sp. 21So2-11]|uniref:hypothetical protein n=1 Tax=Streptomyces sp. 21So2-11 TaxID=3144408 RepID=UPI00321B2B59